ncbi:hypothetical protein FWG95_01030 [Candidatus Saccharibacteria bacterium]|nr:hypothetical protein [Candidatus Saccharibacteria bacterium]
MSKSKKKRDKKYTGRDAKDTSNVVRVRRVNAVARSDRAQWLHDHKKAIWRWSIVTVLVGAVVFLIVQAFMAIGGR